MNQKMKDKIAFFYPSRNIGGAQLLFARLAVYLAKSGKDVLIIDYLDGFVYQYVQEEFSSIDFIKYEDKQLSIDYDICLVQHLSSIHTLRKNLILTDNSKLLFWSIHPYNIISLFRLTPIYTRAKSFGSRFVMQLLEPQLKAKVGNLVAELFKNKAILFMDETNFLPFKKLGLTEEKYIKYLPIPILHSHVYKLRENFSTTHFGWIGRITEEKIKSFNFILQKLDDIAKFQKITFHIIGYGDLAYLKNLKNLAIINHGIVAKEELSELLLNEIDILVAMGTSALESAVLGIPTLLTDISKTKFPKGYKYKWIYQSTNFNLGGYAYEFSGDIDTDQIIKVAFSQEEYKITSEKCKEYVIKNHSMSVVAEELDKAMNNSMFSFKDLKKFY